MDRESNVANIDASRKVNAAASPLSMLAAWQVCLTLNWFAVDQDALFSSQIPRSRSARWDSPFLRARPRSAPFNLFPLSGKGGKSPKLTFMGWKLRGPPSEVSAK